MIYRVDVQISAPVRDTEVSDRVEDAIRNVFPDAEIERRPGEVVATAHSLERLSERLHQQQILDTARSVFFSHRRGNRFAFALKKPAAFEGWVNFSVDDPGELGDITVEVLVDQPDLEAYVDHVAPRTEDGKPVSDQ